MKSIILLFFTIINVALFAQNSKGYLGAKSFISFETILNNPLIYNIKTATNPAYSTFPNDSKNFKKDKLNYGYRFSFDYIFKRNIAFGIEAGVDYSNFYLESYNIMQTDEVNGNYYYSYYITPELIDFKTFSIMPKIEFTTKKGLLPMGLTQQIGIGFSKSQLIEKNYNLSIDHSFGFPNNDSQYLNTHIYDFKNQHLIKTRSIMYAICVRTAISKHIMINYGFRYCLSFTGITYLFDESNDQYNYLLTDSKAKHFVVSQRALNLITFNLGLTYVLFKN